MCVDCVMACNQHTCCCGCPRPCRRHCLCTHMRTCVPTFLLQMSIGMLWQSQTPGCPSWDLSLSGGKCTPVWVEVNAYFNSCPCASLLNMAVICTCRGTTLVVCAQCLISKQLLSETPYTCMYLYMRFEIQLPCMYFTTEILAYRSDVMFEVYIACLQSISTWFSWWCHTQCK